MIRRVSLATLLVAAMLWMGCATPYVKAEQSFFKGDPVVAEKTLTPVAEKETAKDGKMKNLYLWDLGVYRFSQGNYDGAIEAFMQSVKDVEQIDGTAKTVGAALTSAAGQKYIGDPVELSVAYLYLGLSYFMKGDYQNALVGFRRSLEEDLSKDETRRGDMGTTNFLMGECCSRLGKLDDAAVAYRRVIEHEKSFLPAYATLYYTLKKQGNTSDLKRIQGEIEKRASSDYLAAIDNSDGQGIVVVMFAGRSSTVKADALVGAFRQRNRIKQDIESWEVSCNPTNSLHALFQADDMHQHFTDQGGASEEAKKQATRLVAAKAMSAVPILGFFAPSTDADVRFWPTLPGAVHIGYLPLSPGSYTVTVKGFDAKRKPMENYSQSWPDIVVPGNRRALVVLTSWRTASLEKSQ